MKKFFKSIISLGLALFVLFGLTACNVPLSSTTVDDSKTVIKNVSTNGGMTAIYGDYLYFVNGTKANNGSSSRDTVQGSICKIKYDKELGKVEDDTTPEIVVSSLVGFEEGSIYIIGDFLYYSTPCASVNHNGKQLYGKTEFNRLDLVNGSVQNIHTTYYDDTTDAVSFAYYIVGDELYFLVYEQGKLNKLTSKRVCDNTYEVYSILGVQSCVFSDNFGKRVDANKVDANDFIFYTLAATIETDANDDAAKVYKVSPNKNNSEYMGNGLDSDPFKHNHVALIGISNGKLIYSDENIFTNDTSIFAQEIVSESKLEFNREDIITSNSYEEEGELIAIDPSENGEISVVAYNVTATSFQIEYWVKGVSHTMFSFGAKTDIAFAEIATVEEVIEDGEGNKTIDKVKYLIYTVTANNKVSLYKLELSRNGELSTPQNDELILSSDDGMLAITGLMIPEVIQNNLFFIANDKDKNAYMHVVDLSKKVDKEANKVIFVGLK